MRHSMKHDETKPSQPTKVSTSSLKKGGNPAAASADRGAPLGARRDSTGTPRGRARVERALVVGEALRRVRTGRNTETADLRLILTVSRFLAVRAMLDLRSRTAIPSNYSITLSLLR